MPHKFKSVFMFPGQGSQYYQMGYGLYHESPVFRNTLQRLDDIHKSLTGQSVLSLIFDRTKVITDCLDSLAITHPAIFMIQYAMVQTLKSFDVHPDIVLGYSLGEYCALTIAETITPEDAITMLVKQAQIIKAVCQPGFMYAILADREKYLPSCLYVPQIELAAKNFQQHFVIAGPGSSEEALIRNLNSIDALHIKLPIRYGFHSATIEPAIPSISVILGANNYLKPKLPVVSSSNVGYMGPFDKTHFLNVIRMTLNFEETIQMLEKNGPYSYIDIGPSDTLSTFVKNNINPDSNSKIISTLRLSKIKYSISDLKSDLVTLSSACFS